MNDQDHIHLALPPAEACSEIGADFPEEEFDHGMEMLGWLLVLLITCGALWVVLG